jgi:exportin-7
MDANELKRVEMLCTALYQSSNEHERSMAQQQVLVLQSSAEHIPRCQYILDNSTCMFALLVASTSLTKLITTHWNNFTPAQRVDIRNYVLGYLAQKGPSLEKYVTTSLIQLVCRLTKFGWFDDDQFKELNHEVSKFLQATVDHCIIGLQILNELVTEMNQPVSGRNLSFHRKIAVAFREASLFHIFQVALTTVKTLQMKNIPGASADQEKRIADYALNLAIRCLSFDFIGTNPDESSDDAGALQVPTSWRLLIQEPETMTLLFDYYHSSTHAPNSARCLETLMLLASVRRSLFAPDKERGAFLSRLLTGICRIMASQHGLSEPENYHEFCRLLSRLKSNYQLSELMKADSFPEWMDLTPTFTVKSFQQWQWSCNSVHYLLGLWSRLVAALPYVRTERSSSGGSSSNNNMNHGGNGAASGVMSVTFLDNVIPRIVQSYVQSRLDSAIQVSQDSTLDDPLEDEGSLAEQLDKLPTICHYNYRMIGDYLIQVFDSILAQYRDVASNTNINSSSSRQQQQQQQQQQEEEDMSDNMGDSSISTTLYGLEMQLAWLIYIVGSILGGHSYLNNVNHHHAHIISSPQSSGDSGSNHVGGDELIDADLSQRVFSTIQCVEHRLIQSGGQTKCHVHLELAFLHYFSYFRRSYIGEQHGMPMPMPPSSSSSTPSTSSSFSSSAANTVLSPTSSSYPYQHHHHPLHPQLQSHQHQIVMSPNSLIDASLSAKHKSYQRMFERMACGDHTVVVNRIVTHIGQNLKFWGDTEKVIGQTLALFLDIASGYSSGKLLLALDTVQYLIGHHTADEFPFLAIPSNTRHRTSFHSTISRLLFTTTTGVDPYDSSAGGLGSMLSSHSPPSLFDEFVKPIEDVLLKLSQIQNYRQPDVRDAIIGVCRDLRGIFISTHNKRTYNCMFDLIYPAYVSVFTKAADVWYDNPPLMHALLKFLQELSYNKSQRINFDQSSANGILLFRELSQVIVAYGTRMLQKMQQQQPSSQTGVRDVYAEKYKGISICLGILFRALGRITI